MAVKQITGNRFVKVFFIFEQKYFKRNFAGFGVLFMFCIYASKKNVNIYLTIKITLQENKDDWKYLINESFNQNVDIERFIRMIQDFNKILICL